MRWAALVTHPCLKTRPVPQDAAAPHRAAANPRGSPLQKPPLMPVRPHRSGNGLPGARPAAASSPPLPAAPPPPPALLGAPRPFPAPGPGRGLPGAGLRRDRGGGGGAPSIPQVRGGGWAWGRGSARPLRRVGPGMMQQRRPGGAPGRLPPWSRGARGCFGATAAPATPGVGPASDSSCPNPAAWGDICVQLHSWQL